MEEFAFSLCNQDFANDGDLAQFDRGPIIGKPIQRVVGGPDSTLRRTRRCSAALSIAGSIICAIHFEYEWQQLVFVRGASIQCGRNSLYKLAA